MKRTVYNTNIQMLIYGPKTINLSVGLYSKFDVNILFSYNFSILFHKFKSIRPDSKFGLDQYDLGFIRIVPKWFENRFRNFSDWISFRNFRQGYYKRWFSSFTGVFGIWVSCTRRTFYLQMQILLHAFTENLTYCELWLYWRKNFLRSNGTIYNTFGKDTLQIVQSYRAQGALKPWYILFQVSGWCTYICVLHIRRVWRKRNAVRSLKEEKRWRQNNEGCVEARDRDFNWRERSVVVRGERVGRVTEREGARCQCICVYLCASNTKEREACM